MANGMIQSSGSELHGYGRPVENDRSAQPPGGKVMVVGDLSSETVRATHALETLAPTTLANAQEALVALARIQVDVIVADEDTGERGGYEFLRQAAAIQPSAVRVLLDGSGQGLDGRDSADTIVLSKPVDESVLYALCAVALRCVAAQRAAQDLETENDRLRGVETDPGPSACEDSDQVECYEGLLARSSAMKQVFRTLRKIEGTETMVLVSGETGVGKEMVARAIHARSRRAQGSFIAAELGALSGPLRERTLFGHVRGAFPGANQSRSGLFVEARGGCIFLDEVASASPALQVALLRVLEEGKVSPVGSDQSQDIDVRIIAGTKANLPELVRTGCFRQDLYYRLSVFPVEIPPLRERPEDVVPLASHFLASASAALGKKPPSISREARNLLESHQWEGNVRELRTVMERAAAVCKGNLLVAADLFMLSGGEVSQGTSGEEDLTITMPPGGATLQELEREIFLKTLMITDGNQSQAARILGLRESTLRFRLRKLGIASRRLRNSSSQ